MTKYQIIRIRTTKDDHPKAGDESTIIGATVLNQNTQDNFGIKSESVKSVQRITQEIEAGNVYCYLSQDGQEMAVAVDPKASAAIQTVPDRKNSANLLDLPHF